MNNFSIIVVLVLSSAFLCANKYQNPFVNQFDSQINDSATHSIVEIVDGGVPINKTKVNVLVNQRDFYGTDLKTMKSTETEYPNSGFPIEKISFIQYANDWAIKAAQEYSDDITNQSLLSILGNHPQKAFLEIGEKWELIGSEMLKLDITENVSITGVLNFTIEYEFLGIEQISTIWGYLNAAKMNVKTSESFDYFDSIISINGDAVLAEITPFTATSERTEYYIKGFGRYKFNATRNRNTYTERNTNLRSQQSDEWSYPAESVYTESTLISTNINPVATSFSNLTQTHFENNANLDSWTWNGAFPWVYNHATESWFYYAFTGNSYNAYDARSGSWLTFDSGTGAWNPSN